MWNPEKDETIFTCSGKFRTPLHIQLCHKFNVDQEAWPWKGIPMFLRMIEGSASIQVLGAHELEQAGSDVMPWLKERATADLAAVPTCKLEAGESIWLPYGSLPLIIGLDETENGLAKGVDRKSKSKPLDSKNLPYISYALVPAFDTSLTLDSAKLKGIVRASLALSSAWLPASIKSSEDFKAWQKSLEDT